MRTSLYEFFRTFGKAWWIVVGDWIGNVLGIVGMFSTSFAVGWVIAFAITLLGFYVSAGYAFHRLRVERDAALGTAGRAVILKRSKAILRGLANTGANIPGADVTHRGPKFREECARVVNLALGREREEEMQVQVRAANGGQEPWNAVGAHEIAHRYAIMVQAYSAHLRNLADSVTTADLRADWKPAPEEWGLPADAQL